MVRFPSQIGLKNAVFSLIGVAALIAVHAASGNEVSASTDQAKSATRMNCGAKIECTTPDGQLASVSRLPTPDPTAAALIMEDDTITCLLQEGETSFIIELPRTALLDRFKFLNENAAARGELRIAVSNQRLPANSSAWVEVEGIIPFANKRFFGVSLLGIETKFVRLSFRVEKEGRMAALAVYDTNASAHSASQGIESDPLPNRFRASALQDALDSKFANIYELSSAILLTANSPSVAPLSPPAND